MTLCLGRRTSKRLMRAAVRSLRATIRCCQITYKEREKLVEKVQLYSY